ncbi:hypothetical protein DQ392_03385 [Streptomyces reniochalinae]|uniref:Uncharacterized protein n=1 Tax=Streptomyces reniochalinae TaxID=2250578 RepID=A0A367F312_9ACTN|nr:hypothetical protein DQ392_03385 [Streptomyces reniochalinae]
MRTGAEVCAISLEPGTKWSALVRTGTAKRVPGGWCGRAALLGGDTEDAVSDRSSRTLGSTRTALMTGAVFQSLRGFPRVAG